MKVPILAVKQPWAGLIASGKKIIEIRGYPAPQKHIGQQIAIYASRSKPTRADFDHCLNMHGRLHGSYILPHLTRGAIIATATLSSSLKCTGRQDFNCWQHDHWNPLDYYRPEKTYYWVLDNIQALKNPVPFKMPRGAIVWTSIEDTRLNEGI